MHANILATGMEPGQDWVSLVLCVSNAFVLRTEAYQPEAIAGRFSKADMLSAHEEDMLGEKAYIKHCVGFEFGRSSKGKHTKHKKCQFSWYVHLQDKKQKERDTEQWYSVETFVSISKP